MNDKFKGLVLGLSLGVMLTGSVAYASGTQIEVYFQNIKYMFDGIVKTPTEEQGQGFIYNGTTYVPLRFVSEALGKEVQWDGDTQTVWVGKKVDMAAVVATYEGGQVTRGDYEKFAYILRMTNPQYGAKEPDDAFKQYVINQIIASRIINSKLNETDRAEALESAEKQVAEAKSFLDARAADMSKQGITESDIRNYVQGVVATQTWLDSTADEPTVKAAYDQAVANNDESIISASVRHILIMKEDDNGKARTEAEVSQKLKEVQDKLKNGGDFAALAKQYSEDPGSSDNGGLYTNEPVVKWTDAFKKATISLELNKISDPVETEYGYHIIRVESRTTRSYDDVKETIKNQLIDKNYNQFMTKELPALIEHVDLPK
ncbi:peptidylprolyl isomerase [Paenibacillus sp. OAS669]|uniref:peptidylprolyl isomerase n=1 Tax=Paenibacillus sp. OAS669 TaxID=2663821 RepID=UPI00178A077D|nr:peptidylprolyl isomerase [Paenibacillus sp. OAS669]MBE1441721.1 foldase protein PrsA [Paenibacillus sp. OAS669]